MIAPQQESSPGPTKQAEQFTCKKCDRVVRSSSSLPREIELFRYRNEYDYEPVTRFRTFDELLAAGLCQVCREHDAGVHLKGFQSNCLACQLEKRKLAQKLDTRLAQEESGSLIPPRRWWGGLWGQRKQ